MSLKGRDMVSLKDYTRDEIDEIWKVTKLLKDKLRAGVQHHTLEDKSLAMFFEIPSTRTSISFETAMIQLGGQGIFLSPGRTWIGTEESWKDAMQVIARYNDGIAARLMENKTLRDIADWVDVPVINGSDDTEHPCQALTDFYSVKEKGRDLKNLKYSIVWGWRHSNPPMGIVTSSLYCAPKFGVDLTIAAPEPYLPPTDVINKAKADAEASGGSITLTTDHDEAYENADIIYSYSWVSPEIFTKGLEMHKAGKGFSAPAPHLEQADKYKHWRVTDEHMKIAGKNSLFMNPMPVARGEEVDDSVCDGPQSIMIDEAENRLHVQKAILTLLMGGKI